MHAVHAGFVRRLLSRFCDGCVDFFLRLGDHFFNATRVNAPVRDQFFEREPRDFAPHRIEARHDDRIRCVVDDDVDARREFECANVAALASDDAPLHLVAGQ
ncbi:hypothetical protein D3C83_23700 [compost metagenome]